MDREYSEYEKFIRGYEEESFNPRSILDLEDFIYFDYVGDYPRMTYEENVISGEL